MRLRRGGAYTSDIRALRANIRANGTLATIKMITISHPDITTTVDLYINLAYQQNSNFPPVNGSLYTVAFGNANGVWHFNVGNIGVPLPGQLFPGALTGTYASLGYPIGLPNIKNGNLANAITDVSGYVGGPVGTPVLNGMARLIIAVNEAVRFNQVESGVDGVLGNSGNYSPPVEMIHNWGGHTLGS